MEGRPSAMKDDERRTIDLSEIAWAIWDVYTIRPSTGMANMIVDCLGLTKAIFDLVFTMCSHRPTGLEIV